jgi:anion-transporting  ArsA/GET3 family ATPase
VCWVSNWCRNAVCRLGGGRCPEASERSRQVGGGLSANGGSPASLAELVAERAIIVCAGPGGVGKTTTAASLALAAAQGGRRAVVITIDPARRLADALGLSAGLTNEPQLVAGVGPGELWAMMLDPKATFDDVVGRYAKDEGQRDRILSNAFYRNVAGKLSGTQEYMAAEKLYELHHDVRFDLVVIDTPPTRHALDVIDAPRRLVRFLDHRLYRALVMPARVGLKVMNIASQVVLRTVAKVVGAEMIADVMAFFQAFDGMEAGFSARSSLVLALLTSPDTAYVIVAAPRRDRLEEATWLSARLAERDIRPAALVVNRAHPNFGISATEARAQADALAKPKADLSETWATWVNVAELAAVAESEAELIKPLAAAVAPAPVVLVPLLDHDVHDLAGLGDVTGYLLGR